LVVESSPQVQVVLLPGLAAVQANLLSWEVVAEAGLPPWLVADTCFLLQWEWPVIWVFLESLHGSRLLREKGAIYV